MKYAKKLITKKDITTKIAYNKNIVKYNIKVRSMVNILFCAVKMSSGSAYFALPILEI